MRIEEGRGSEQVFELQVVRRSQLEFEQEGQIQEECFQYAMGLPEADRARVLGQFASA